MKKFKLWYLLKAISLCNFALKFTTELNKMNDELLCKFLREHSSGFYRPCAEAAARIEQLKREIEYLRHYSNRDILAQVEDAMEQCSLGT